MRHLIYQDQRLRNIPDWVEYIAADSSGEIFGFSEEPTWIVLSGKAKGGCWRATKGQVELLGVMRTPRRVNKLMMNLVPVEDATWALDVLNKFEYSDDLIKRYPSEDEYNRAMEILHALVEKT